jgi:quinol monooxygenase YgiN
MAAGIVHLPFYATGFRGDDLEAALAELAPISTRYGATRYEVYRSRDDRYKFLHTTSFDNKDDFERYWYGEEFVAWRTDYSSCYQVPVLYVWNDVIASGSLATGELTGAAAPAEGDTI